MKKNRKLAIRLSDLVKELEEDYGGTGGEEVAELYNLRLATRRLVTQATIEKVLNRISPQDLNYIFSYAACGIVGIQ